ncbi:MAG TPA: LiaF domain-containing protein, partial [Gemmatimonadaceae bacterium]|nr:LiaF domain-containing protein [Gemmatimonadaceae bacterium]
VDNLTLDELDRRMEQVYRVTSVAALRDITRDLPTAGGSAAAASSPRSLAPVDAFPVEHGRIVSIMSETKRQGLWQLPRKLDVWSIMSETRLDLTESQLMEGVTEIRLHALMCAIKIVVPPGVRVVMQAGALMATVQDDLGDQPPVGSRAPVVRITGRLVMGELKVSTRRRED